MPAHFGWLPSRRAPYEICRRWSIKYSHHNLSTTQLATLTIRRLQNGLQSASPRSTTDYVAWSKAKARFGSRNRTGLSFTAMPIRLPARNFQRRIPLGSSRSHSAKESKRSTKDRISRRRSIADLRVDRSNFRAANLPRPFPKQQGRVGQHPTA